MSDTISLRTFPSSSAEELAVIYLNTLELKGKSPEEIARLYDDALHKVKEEQKKIRQEKHSTGQHWSF